MIAAVDRACSLSAISGEEALPEKRVKRPRVKQMGKIKMTKNRSKEASRSRTAGGGQHQRVDERYMDTPISVHRKVGVEGSLRETCQ